ncbi:snare-complex protein syntaxin-18 N-terminus-domain-containing protein [Lophiotrema nucula]|uniref:Snare-complex protein syntaxin-18 N-terminus-domain-containing protein n=1 Tax=Lophiotrema nucula TaxID=690887 RepID=A0A6A5Z1T0_9PLEO|nr:snare-complex protein syntaxin-18 N-terminus-domain-containing protein [Lophiotrema nucula]
MDVTPVFNEILTAHDSRPVEPHVFRLQDLDEFLKEAYRIRSHLVELNKYLRSIRQSYLSTAHAPRRKQAARTGNSSSITAADADSKHLSDDQRTEIDAQAKQLLRELNHAISSLSEAEQIRQQASAAITLKRRAKQGFGLVGRWAAGGGITGKSPEEELEDAKASTVRVHRESIIWYLQQQLQMCGQFQASMMEIRLKREVEKSKSVLYKARGTMPTSDQSTGMNGLPSASSGFRGKASYVPEDESRAVEQQLSPEQLQLFAEENQDMLKHYEDTLDQVRTTEKSLVEISELQTTLANNLSVQSAHIEQLVEDSYLTTENIGGGNKELKKAAERKSTARLLFYSTSIFCATLVLWDLFI